MIREVFENESFVASPELSQHLARTLGGNFRREADGRVRITRVAGSLRLPDGETLAIRSRKAPLACLLTWAAYAYPELSALTHMAPSLAGADDGDLASVLARVFCDELHRAVQSSGLLRQYRRQDVISPTIRGRIDFAKLARVGHNLAQVPCVVFSRLPTTPLNAMLSAAIAVVTGDALMRRAAGPSLGTLSAIFADVHPRVDLELASGKLPLSRLEKPFAASLALALLLVQAHGLTSGAGKRGLAFLINLANLFERSIARTLCECIEGTSAKRTLRYFRGPIDDARFGGSMQIDLLLEHFDTDRRPVVVDAKYKTSPASANLQQMLAYCWMTGARQAVLVFPAGHLADRRSFRYRGADGSTIAVHLVEFETGATRLDEWEAAGRRLADQIRRVVDSG